jgi:predicted membrane protein
VPAKTFILSGAWHIRVENGKILFLDIKFTKVHLDASNRHVHEITNFHPANINNTSIQLNANGTTTIMGTTDVALNQAATWNNVKTVIVIDKLSTITVMLDPKDTSNHFLGQSIYGTVNMLKDKEGNSVVTFPRP